MPTFYVDSKNDLPREIMGFRIIQKKNNSLAIAPPINFSGHPETPSSITMPTPTPCIPHGRVGTPRLKLMLSYVKLMGILFSLLQQGPLILRLKLALRGPNNGLLPSGSTSGLGGIVCRRPQIWSKRQNHVFSVISTICEKTSGLTKTKHATFFLQIKWVIDWWYCFYIFISSKGRKIRLCSRKT